jgi:hypothetical protein
MTKLKVDAALDHKVAHAMGLKSVHNCEKWVGLTVDELITLEQKHMRHEDLSRAIEAKLKEKNA